MKTQFANRSSNLQTEWICGAPMFNLVSVFLYQFKTYLIDLVKKNPNKMNMNNKKIAELSK